MSKKARLGLYLENEDVKKRVKIAAAKRGLSTTTYCVRAIKDQLRRDGEVSDDTDKTTLLARIDKRRKEIGLLGMTARELVETGRRK
jgi:hypothetical protein